MKKVAKKTIANHWAEELTDFTNGAEVQKILCYSENNQGLISGIVYISRDNQTKKISTRNTLLFSVL